MTSPRALTSDALDYELPRELIAQHPAPERGAAQLMVVQAGITQPLAIDRFDECFLGQLRPDDLVVANDARVLHARIAIRRVTGGSGELLLLNPADEPAHDAAASRWVCMARPARKLRPDTVVTTATGSAEVRIISRVDSQSLIVELPCTLEDAPAWMRLHGELPLPPYVTERGQQPERYQTIHARAEGSVAAPTAGLHFDEAMWSAVRDTCEVAHVTLHVGAGTFLPLPDGPLAEQRLHEERYVVPAATDALVRDALEAGRRIVAVGTTTARVLEHVYARGVEEGSGGDRSGGGGGAGGERTGTGTGTGVSRAGATRMFIQPGHDWACVGALLTNFHLPRSSLIALVMAFHGEDPTRAAYAAAIDARMRFYSFGDAMFLHGPPLRAAGSTGVAVASKVRG